jgi:hypothetical protein
MRPIAGLHTEATLVGPPKLKETIQHEWRFRGAVQGINDPDFYEVRPHCGIDAWYRATLTGQRQDGCFEAMVLMSDRHGWPAWFHFPAVEKEDVRDATTHMSVSIPERHLELEVPKGDPSQAVLKIDGGSVADTYFARQSPALGDDATSKHILIQTTRLRDRATCNVGHETLSHFLSGAVRFVSSNASRLNHTWKIQLGPFATHTIQVEKRYHFGKYINLVVDGTTLVQARANDIGCKGDWRCKFRFVGERSIDFEVNETDANGTILDSRARVTKKYKYSHECSVVVGNLLDLSSATLFVDNVSCHMLPEMMAPRQEEPIHMGIQAMKHAYGIIVPFKVKDPVSHSSPGDVSESSLGKRGVVGIRSFWNSLFCAAQEPMTDDSQEIVEIQSIRQT